MSEELQNALSGLQIHENPYKLPENLLNHIILPRYIPPNANDDYDLTEATFLTRMDIAMSSISEWLPSGTTKMFSSFVAVHQMRTPQPIIDGIKNLQPGCTFAMYVRCQNTVFMCHMPADVVIVDKPNETTPIIVATFPGRIGTRHVYSHPLDMEISYPVQALKVTFSTLLRSPEFAHQLCLLTQEQMQIDSDGRKVSNWLVAALTNGETTTATLDEFPVLTKKIRDECIAVGNYGYFRRSGMYTVIKAILHHNLTVQCGESIGRFVYKVVMLHFMNDMCRSFTDAPPEAINIDLMSQMIAKLSRRIEKLQNERGTIKDQESDLSKYDEIFDRVVNDTKKSIAQIRLKIDAQIKTLETKVIEEAKLAPLIGLNISDDSLQSVQKLKKYIETRKMGDPNMENPNQLRIYPVKRHYAKQELPDATTVDENDDMTTFFNDVEWFILYETDLNSIQLDGEQIKDLTDQYTRWSLAIYHAVNKLGISRSILTRLKLLALLDKVACTEYPMLLEHRPSVNLLWFDELLLPQRVDMEAAYELEQYFQKRHKEASYPGLIEHNHFDENSFSVRFARESPEMCNLRDTILEMADTKVEEKRRDWSLARKVITNLRNQLAKVSCTCWTENSDKCASCSYKRRIQNMRILEYEYPLPDDVDEQYAICFDFLIPENIAYLRDVLYDFNEFPRKNATMMKIKNNWERNDTIAHYALHSFKIPRVVHVGQMTEQKQRPRHVDCTFNSLILKTPKNCLLHAHRKRFSLPQDQSTIRSICALLVEPDSPYCNFQWLVHGTDHTQNQVLATQHQCPETMPLSEYKNFGSLRADGGRLQWRKLIGMIECDALCFEQMSVVSLCLQAIWQQNPIGEYKWTRESHVDLLNDQFVLATIELLNKFVDKHRGNWFHPTKLLLAVFMVVRCIEINESADVFNKCMDLLRKQRKIAIEWCERIVIAIRGVGNADQATEMEMRRKLTVAAIAGCATYFVHAKHKFFEQIFQEEDTSIWLQLIVTLDNSLRITGASPNLLMFLQLVRSIGINLETTVKAAVMKDPSHVIEFVQNRWATALDCSVAVYFATECPQTLVVEVDVNGTMAYVTIDIICGTFLVNYLPIARLPTYMTSHPLFVGVFEDFIFEVQSSGNHTFITTQKYDGCTYVFKAMPEDSVLVIIERHTNGTEVELIPPEQLTDEIPYLLHTNYSHWWHKSSNFIEFRPKRFADKAFKTNIEYKLDLNVKHLTHLQTNRRMLDVTSQSYCKIIEYLKRLESDKFVHIFMAKDPVPSAEIELVRMRLKFVTSGAANGSDLISNEFSGMRVSLNQNCGSLFGLRSGLLLEAIAEGSKKEKILLMPHGQVTVQRTHNHVNVDIDVNGELRKPPFHQYQVDKFSRQIRSSSGGFSAWFNLAYLHAVTSHGEIEPLLGMSATERALQILQSDFVWSSAPYDPEAIQILHDIAILTPVRMIYNNPNTQFIEWPAIVPPRSAQDSFAFIVTRLLNDSKRLSGLHIGDATNPMYSANLPIIHAFKLNHREYRRNRLLSPNTNVSSAFLSNEIPKSEMPIQVPVIHSQNTRKIAKLYHAKTFQVVERNSVSTFLLSRSEVSVSIDREHIDNLINHTSYAPFINLWFALYDAARSNRYNHHQFALIFSLLAHNGAEINVIMALQTVVANFQLFADLYVPTIDKCFLGYGDYAVTGIRGIAIANIIYLEKYYQPNQMSQRVLYEAKISSDLETLTEFMESSWPCAAIQKLPSEITTIDRKKTLDEINRWLAVWYDNYQLKRFLQDFEQLSQRIVHGANLPMTLPAFECYHKPTPKHMTKYEIDWTAKMCIDQPCFSDVLDEAEGIWCNNLPLGQRPLSEWWSIYTKITQPIEAEHLIHAGLSPRLVPSLVLPQIASSTTLPRVKALIGMIALSTVDKQRRTRIALFESQMKQLADHEHEPHTEWRPCDYPEWLLFEIEQNVCIRPIQIEVAKRMIDPPDIGTKHSVMQLNMGEGKTSVIVPILAAYLANGKQVCQVTVLKSLYATNGKALRQYLGGMLNRKLYLFPCRRDMPIEEYAGLMLQIYEECKREKGVILTLPEYRLSLRLKLYESIKKGKIKAAFDLFQIHDWIHSNVRNILDESDAILHAKFQLVYTVGSQLPIDGGELRWIVTQAVMKRVPEHMRRLYHKHGAEKIEFNEKYLENHGIFAADRLDYRSDVFTPCRLLDQTIFEELKVALIEDFIAGKIHFPFPEMIETTKEYMRYLLNHKNINKYTFALAVKTFSLQEQNAFMILSGLLRFEVLRLVLSKRWRVNYGVNVKGHRKMAVPFKAKDVAAEMTEFGHGDVAICFTLLSYYYSGLTDEQLHHVFRLLHRMSSANEIYEQWIINTPHELIDESIRSHSGINLCDPHQRDEILFPLFRFNMHVIDFYLSQTVFPREAKTFEQKLMCTAWDLCSESFVHPVTGFSGTNDTKDILPLPIRQNDLKKLENTNDRVRAVLLQPENQTYAPLPANVSAKEILTNLIEQFIPVLLDAGALMLELNNEQVAREWLGMTTECWYDAAVYFDDHDVLQTIDRNGARTEFDCSVYREKLDRCLVYLDDTHTRGTDLKFPLNHRACVTLSGDITRDKTVQACMRMRKLGHGQSIAFFASYEADIRIREICRLTKEDEIINEHVIKFISHNSREFEVENMSHWSMAAVNYTKKLAGHRVHKTSNHDTMALMQLYVHCVDGEFIELKQLYGDKTELPLSEIASGKFDSLQELFAAEGVSINVDLKKFIETMKTDVVTKITIQAPNIRRFTQTLDDQQEKELENEAEQERQIERPDSAIPQTPQLSDAVKDFLNNGDVNLLKHSDFVPMSSALLNTLFFKSYKDDQPAWADHLFVTRDFVSVIAGASIRKRNPSKYFDEYLRPVWWIAQTRSQGQTILVCLSSFECNRLMPLFEKSTISTLFMYRPRLSRFRSNLVDFDGLQVSGQSVKAQMQIKDIAQVGMFAGGMYFGTEEEQDAYCEFMGLIPRPRIPELNAAFNMGRISVNGYVDVEHRQRSRIEKYVGRCRFKRNPVDLAIGIIEAHNQTMSPESHVASILKKGIKKTVENAKDSRREMQKNY